MIPYNIVAGSTDVSVVIRIIDSGDGTPETGVVFNTSGIDLQYRRELAASTAITEATLAALTTAHTDGGFLHIGNGYYRLDLPDAAVATGSSGCLVHGTVTGMVVIGCYIHLTPYPADVRQWLGTAAATPTTAGVPEVDVTHWLGTGAATPTTAGVPEVDVTHWGGTAVGSTTVRANLISILGTTLTETAGQIAAAFKKWFDVATPTGTVNSVPDAVAGAAGGLFIAGTNAATTANITGNLSGSVGSVTGAVGSVTGAVGSVTGAVGSVTGAVGSVTGLTASDVGAIKTQTDKLTFTVANQVDANVQSINDTAVTGDGSATPWGPV